MFNHRLKIQQSAEKEARRQAGINKRRGPRKKRQAPKDMALIGYEIAMELRKGFQEIQ